MPNDYVAVKPCGCVVAWASEDLEKKDPKGLAKEVSSWIREGFSIQRCSTEEARQRICRCKCNMEYIVPKTTGG